MKGVLHIGMPKCMSTSIQAYLREAPQVYFAGVGPSQHIKADMLVAFQRHIMRTPSQFYDAGLVEDVFAEHRRAAADRGAQFFALSDETIPFPFGYGRSDTSYLERLLRLKAVMPENTGVLMIVRRPEAYLKSAFKYRTVMNGMSFSYEDFLKRLLLLGDTYMLGTVKYYNYAEAARRIFGSVTVVAMEAIEDDEGELLRHFGVPPSRTPVHGRLPRENSGMPNEKFANFRELHAPYGDTLSDDGFNVLSPADRTVAHASPYYGGILASALSKEQTLGTMRHLAMQMPDRDRQHCFAVSDDTRDRLAAYVAESNALLRTHYGVDTEDYAYDLF